jgi:glyoxylase-like metal-dependent hydrolase (beta-lactamase superfamily II)
MNIYRLPVGELRANCYIIETANKNAVAVDTGSDFPKIKSFLDENGLTLKKILLTHGHYDHIGAVKDAVLSYGAEVYIHEEDAPMLESRTKSLADAIGAGAFNEVADFKTVKDGDIITLDELSFEVIHTPGHTKGGVCYKCGNSLFTGDTLFKLSMGRTDFPGGSLGEMIWSLRKLAVLDGDYDVYPGHNETSTLSFERKNNPCLKGNPYEDNI